jgi:hypothetical protein
MKSVGLTVLAAIAFAACTIVILERLKPREAPAPAAADPALHKRLVALEAKLAACVRLIGGSESRPADVSPPPSVGQRLEDIETSLFDFERDVRREMRLLYDKTRMRFDELDARLEGLTSRPATPEDRARTAGDLKSKGVILDAAAKRFEIKGLAGHPSRVLEFLAATPGGPTHESLFVLPEVLPSAVHRATRELGLAPGKGPNLEAGRPPQGDGLYLYVAWEGRATPIRIEKLIRNQRSGERLKLAPFVFVGSRQVLRDDTWDSHYAADVYKHVVGLTFNYSGDSVFAPVDEACADEHVWIPDAETVPEPETEVRLIFSVDAVPAWDA